ncbi:MAG: NosD domain-containing protein [Candidatus Thermoplasmatota archaeon]
MDKNTSIVEVTNLNTHEKFSSIQAAIDDPDTIDGHTILVGIGTFYENVIITKSITLRGTAVYDSIIDGRGIGDVVSILVDNVIVTHLTIRNSGPFPLSGVNVWSSRNNISTNMITGNGNGIYCSHTSFTGIYDNLITNNDLGIFLTYSWHNVISHNILEGNREYGLNVMVSSNRNSISNNMILGNRNAGISLYNVSMNVLQQNIVAWNGIGVLQSYSSSNLFYHNNFINNTRQVGGHNTSYNIWDLGYPIGGNYWSDYTGVDANGDGIGDTPYYICEGNIDHYPLMTEHIIRK